MNTIAACLAALVLHLDFNSVQLKKPVVEGILDRAAAMGYDSVLWEIENKVRWESHPEIVGDEAFTKAEFREILAHAKRLGLRPIPLFQILGHGEYVLMHGGHGDWMEDPSFPACYCVSKGEVRRFMKDMIHEYLELFGDDVKDFHLGCDEAKTFHTCPSCRSKGPKFGLFLEHFNDVTAELREKGVKPGIWCDLLFDQRDTPEVKSLADKVTVWFWDYKSDGYAHVKPQSRWQGQMDVFEKLGFDIILSTSSESYRDSAYLPRYREHGANVAWGAKYAKTHGYRGVCVTSWSVHCSPKETQYPLWETAAKLWKEPSLDARRVLDEACVAHFGVPLATVETLTDWEAAICDFQGEEWGRLIKPAIPAPKTTLAEVSAVMARKFGPDWRRTLSAMVIRYRRNVEAGLKELGTPNTRVAEVLREGALLQLAYLDALAGVLAGRPLSEAPIARTTAYYALEQSPRSAALSAEITWSTLLGDHQPLWQKDAVPYADPKQLAVTEADAHRPDFKPDNYRMPYLEWYAAPAASNRTDCCMILVAGDSYTNRCDTTVADKFAAYLIGRGIRCVRLVCRASAPNGQPVYQSAWQDGQRAVRLVRSRAKELGFNPQKIGVLGVADGAHLAMLLAFSSQTSAYPKCDALDDVPCHVNWGVPLFTSRARADQPDACFRFDAKTCPLCLIDGGKERCSAFGSTRFYRCVRERKIPAEIHLYGDTKGTVRVFEDCHERVGEFIRQMDFDGRLGREVALDHRYFPGDTIRTEKESLWPTGRIPDFSAKQNIPYLVWFVPEKPTTKAIQVLLPGGGYSSCNFNGECTPVAHCLNGKGMTAVAVMYRTPLLPGRPKHAVAWQDAQRAIRMVRAEAPQRGLDPDRIGVMGFSAGGHLTLMTATNAEIPAYAPVDEVDAQSCAVRWAVPVYPAYALTDGADRPNVTGGNADWAVPVAEFSFDAKTPPMCFLHGDADCWAAMNSVRCWEQLRQMGLAGDVHTFVTRGHCFQIKASPDTGSWTWLDRLWDFLKRGEHL